MKKSGNVFRRLLSVLIFVAVGLSVLTSVTWAASTDASGVDFPELDCGISVMSNDGISLLSDSGNGGITFTCVSGGWYRQTNSSTSLNSYDVSVITGGFDSDGYSQGTVTQLAKPTQSSVTYNYYFGATSSYYVDVYYPVLIPAGTAFTLSIRTMLYLQETTQNPANVIGSGNLHAFTGGCTAYVGSSSYSVPLASGLYFLEQSVSARTSDLTYIRLRFTAPSISSPSFRGFKIASTVYGQVADTSIYWRYSLSGFADVSGGGIYSPILTDILDALNNMVSPDYSGSLSSILTAVNNATVQIRTAVNNSSTAVTGAVNNTTTTITNIFQSTQEQIDAAKEVTDQISDKAAEIKDQSEQVAAGTPQIDAPALAQAHNPMDFVDKTDPVYTAGVDLMQSFLSSSLIMTMLMLSLSLSLVGYVLHGKRA